MRGAARALAVVALAIAGAAAAGCRTTISIEGVTLDVPDWRVVQLCTYDDGEITAAVSLDPESGWIRTLIKGAFGFAAGFFTTGQPAVGAAGAGVAAIDELGATSGDRPVCWENYSRPGEPKAATPRPPVEIPKGIPPVPRPAPPPAPQREALELAPPLRPDERPLGVGPLVWKPLERFGFGRGERRP